MQRPHPLHQAEFTSTLNLFGKQITFPSKRSFLFPNFIYLQVIMPSCESWDK